MTLINTTKRSGKCRKFYCNLWKKTSEGYSQRVTLKNFQQIRENRERLRPIIEALISLGLQKISIRRHKDYRKLIIKFPNHLNEGNSPIQGDYILYHNNFDLSHCIGTFGTCSIMLSDQNGAEPELQKHMQLR